MMQFDFFVIEETPNGGKPAWRFIDSVQAPHDNAKAKVDARFQELVAADGELLNVIIFSSATGSAPPGAVVAAEEVHAWPPEIRKKQGKPQRQLIWVTDPTLIS